MARDHNGHGVRVVCLADGAARLRPPDLLRDGGVGRGFSVRNASQRLPAALLELSAVQVEVELEAGALPGEVLAQLANEGRGLFFGEEPDEQVVTRAVEQR